MKTPQLNQRQISEIISNAVQNVYLPEIVKVTPKQTGDTANGWRVLIESNKVYLVNIRFGDIVKFLEDGTKPHVIRPRRAKALRFELGDKIVFAKKVHHPGIKARKFIQKTLNDKTLNDRFEKEIDIELQKLLDSL